MMFRGRQASSYLLLLTSSNRHFLFSQMGKECNHNVHSQLQRQQQFGSNSLKLLASKEDKKQQQNQEEQFGKNFLKVPSLTNEGLAVAADNRLLDEKLFQLNPNDVLLLKMERGTKRKSFKLSLKSFGKEMEKRIKFVPEDAYRMVNIMDNMLNSLVARIQPEMHNSSKSGPLAMESLCVNADRFNMQLELVRLDDDDDNNNVYEFKMSSMKAVQHKEVEREMRLPIQALSWLRQTMAQMLTEHGQQQLDPTPPPPELSTSILLQDLAKKRYNLGRNDLLWVSMRQRRGGGSLKFIQIDKMVRSIKLCFDLPQLRVEESYRMISAMDNLLNTLAAAKTNADGLMKFPLQSERIVSDFFDIQLEVDSAKECKIKYVKKNPVLEMCLPIRVLPWLRQSLTQMLAEHDGSQQLGPAPPELPESILKAASSPTKSTADERDK